MATHSDQENDNSGSKTFDLVVYNAYNVEIDYYMYLDYDNLALKYVHPSRFSICALNVFFNLVHIILDWYQHNGTTITSRELYMITIHPTTKTPTLHHSPSIQIPIISTTSQLITPSPTLYCTLKLVPYTIVMLDQWSTNKLYSCPFLFSLWR